MDKQTDKLNSTEFLSKILTKSVWAQNNQFTSLIDRKASVNYNVKCGVMNSPRDKFNVCITRPFNSGVHPCSTNIGLSCWPHTVLAVEGVWPARLGKISGKAYYMQ